MHPGSLAVGIVAPPSVHAAWAAALRNLWLPPGTRFLWGEAGRCVSSARNAILSDALASGAEWLLWLDADTCLPDYGFLGLLAAAKDLGGAAVSAVVWLRGLPDIPCVVRSDGVRVSAEDCRPGRPRFVAARVGCGAMLVRLDLIPPSGPWFRWEGGEESEDFYFCRVCLDSRVLVCPDVQCAHLTLGASASGGWLPFEPGQSDEFSDARGLGG